MFGTRLYQYGSDPKNKIRLTPAEADAINKIRIYNFDPETGFAQVNLTDEEMIHYDRAATKLNAYLETHEVPYTDEDIAADIPVIRPIK